MPGTQEDIKNLIELNKVDKVIFDCKKTLDESPLKQQILDVRSKKAAVKQKREQVDKIFVTARAELNTMSEKDSLISEDINKTQKEIESYSQDYRKVQDASKKLSSLKAQREKIDAKLAQVEQNYNKIKELKNQIDNAIEKFSMEEDKLTQNFVSANAIANQKLLEATEKRKQLQDSINQDALKVYGQALDRVGANCISEIEGTDVCSVCRNKLSALQISKARQEAPLSKCPHCSRLLLVNQ